MIPIRNIYYMLAYAFQVLHEQGYKDVAAEDFRNTAELLAAILCKGVSVQIKRGLCRQYITKEEPLASPRGKLEIGESIKTQVLRKKQLVCAYDEFSVNAYTNRIIKTTMAVLLRADITKARKKEIRKLLVFFDGVDTLDAHNINWNILNFLTFKNLNSTTSCGFSKFILALSYRGQTAFFHHSINCRINWNLSLVG